MDPKAHTFEFTSYNLDREKQVVNFQYTIHFDNGSKIDLLEKLILPEQPINYGSIPPALLDKCLQNLHLMNGVSYWKLYCPPEIRIQNNFLNKEQADFWNTIYSIGMGEFYYRNNIDFRELVHFPYLDNKGEAIPFLRSDRSLIGIGGGKDSIVAYELLKTAGEQMTGFVVSHGPEHIVVDGVVKQMGIDTLRVKRQLDKQLTELNKRSDTYNGHVPVSAIFAFIGVLLSVLYDYSYVVVTNERSAESGNTEWKGYTINHQWSKTLEFETVFREYIQKWVTVDVTYFSLLRPFTELKIVELFSSYKQYFPYFSSCNRNFRITPLRQGFEGHGKTLWCGECAKCAFVFGLLSALIAKSELITIFGKNLFADEKLVPMYEDLLGYGTMKPFDCVGPFEETQVALYLSLQKGEYKGDIIMEMFERDILPQIKNIEELKKEEFRIGSVESIPERFRASLK
jgi:hypothetical protein